MSFVVPQVARNSGVIVTVYGPFRDVDRAMAFCGDLHRSFDGRDYDAYPVPIKPPPRKLSTHPSRLPDVPA